jgi:membrane protein YdbS with pleckstrin-like domain
MMHGFNLIPILLQLLITLGFAYLLWIFAVKESMPLKTIGQVISIAIIIFAVLALAMPVQRHSSGYRMGKHMNGPVNMKRIEGRQNPNMEMPPMSPKQNLDSKKGPNMPEPVENQ